MNDRSNLWWDLRLININPRKNQGKNLLSKSTEDWSVWIWLVFDVYSGEGGKGHVHYYNPCSDDPFAGVRWWNVQVEGDLYDWTGHNETEDTDSTEVGSCEPVQEVVTNVSRAPYGPISERKLGNGEWKHPGKIRVVDPPRLNSVGNSKRHVHQQRQNSKGQLNG